MKKNITLSGAEHVVKLTNEHRRSCIDVISAKICSILPTSAEEGFTLAEVLITLGIIGVVAAMTIPTLIANINGAKYRSQLKKSISTLSQAGLLSQEQFGYDYAGASKGFNSMFNIPKEHPETDQTRAGIFNGTLKGSTYIGYASSSFPETYKSYKIKHNTYYPSIGSLALYQLPDGSLVGFPQYLSKSADGTNSCDIPPGTIVSKETINNMTSGILHGCLGFIDVNGVSGPNEETKCSDGSDAKLVETPCVVKPRDIKDVYPILFHNATVEPATAAGKYILNTAK